MGRNRTEPFFKTFDGESGVFQGVADGAGRARKREAGQAAQFGGVGLHAVAEGAVERGEGVGEINDEGEASAGDQDAAGFAAEAGKVRVAGGPGGDSEGGGTGGASGEKIQQIGEVPLNGGCAGA